MCCAQVDYADEDLKAFANNFGLNISFSVRPEAARAAGFMNYPLLAKNWTAKIPGQFVVEGTGCNDLCVAPDYDVKAMLKELRGGNADQKALSEPRISSSVTAEPIADEPIPKWRRETQTGALCFHTKTGIVEAR